MNMTISYSKLRNNLKSVLDQVCADHEPMLIERQNGEDVVLISQEDYSSWAETMYLLRSPANASRLLSALNADSSKQTSFDSIDDLKTELGIR